MRFQKLFVSVAGFAAVTCLTIPVIGAERTVVGEYFTATW